ncbi:DUF4352 domain-containing protein [Streptomyces flavofungini]|uniref:DUF4352 domain-containing protein n=1 Tax=Streptomyces flavofungini TaxID=68200 RepID=UPI0034DEDD49
MRNRLSGIAATVLALGALTACGTDGGGTVADPEATVSTGSSGSGDTISLRGLGGGSGLDVTVVKVADPARSAEKFSAPERGKRWLGIQFRLVNTGTTAYADSPQNGVQVTDADGQRFQTMFAEITAGPAMSADVRLRPGAKALGWVVVELPADVTPTAVQFTMDSGMADHTGEWQLT